MQGTKSIFDENFLLAITANEGVTRLLQGRNEFCGGSNYGIQVLMLYF